MGHGGRGGRARAGCAGRVAAGAALLAALGCASAADPEGAVPRLAPGDHEIALAHGGRSRSYRVHVPPQAAGGAPLPVVLSFHGGGGNAAGHERQIGLDALADRKGVVAVYPDGTGRLGLHTWNAGDCCGRAARDGVDDVGFTVALLADLARRTPVDPNRVYGMGHSNGAMMVYRLAQEIPERLAAVAAVGGVLRPERVAPRRPMPILHVHSVDDPRALWAGGLGPPFPLTGQRVLHGSVEASLGRWIAFDGCPAAPETGETRRWRDHTATRLRFAPCRDGVEVVLWKLTGAGHGWPGGAPASRRLERRIGPSTQVIDATAEAWAFFQRFSRRDAAPLAP